MRSNCHVDQSCRKRCPSCRFQKCLVKGMKTHGTVENRNEHISQGSAQRTIFCKNLFDIFSTFYRKYYHFNTIRFRISLRYRIKFSKKNKLWAWPSLKVQNQFPENLKSDLFLTLLFAHFWILCAEDFYTARFGISFEFWLQQKIFNKLRLMYVA